MMIVDLFRLQSNWFFYNTATGFVTGIFELVNGYLTTELGEGFHRVKESFSQGHRMHYEYFVYIIETMNEIDVLTERILKLAFKIHSTIGPGLLESTYKECLFYELKKNGIHVEKEKAMPFYYEEIKMDVGYRVDLLIENKVIVELKCVECFTPVHVAQLITYLKLSHCKIGLLLNYKTSSLKHGIKRVMI